MVITNTANLAQGFWGMYRLKRSVLFSDIKRPGRQKVRGTVEFAYSIKLPILPQYCSTSRY